MTKDEARGLLARPVHERRVEYRPAHRQPEQGVVTAVNDRYVFVRYDGQLTAQATNPADLHLV